MLTLVASGPAGAKSHLTSRTSRTHTPPPGTSLVSSHMHIRVCLHTLAVACGGDAAPRAPRSFGVPPPPRASRRRRHCVAMCPPLFRQPQYD